MRQSVLTVAFAASIALSGCANSSQNAAARTAIQAAYDRQSAGYVNHKPDAVMAECSPNYTELNEGKTDSRAHTAKVIAAFIGIAEKLDATATVRNVTVTGDTADVIVDRHFDLLTFPLKNKTEAIAKQHQFVSDETNDDTWINIGGKWLKLQSVTQISKSSFDGVAESS